MSSKTLIEKLFSNKRYDSQAESIAMKISEKTTMRHTKWLVSMKYIVDQEDVDTVLSLQHEYCEQVIFEERERVTNNQRILLQCEKQKVIERKQKIDARQAILDKVVTRVAARTEQLMLDRLTTMPVEKLLWGFPDYAHFSSFAYSASLNFSKLGTLTTLSHALKTNVLELVGNAKFCKAIGKTPKKTNDPKVAIGYLGIDNCRKLFPVLMTKPLLKWTDTNTKSAAPKIWQQMIVTCNATRMRLQSVGYKEPDEGILIGIIRTLSLFSISNYFTQIFEDGLVSVMKEYRDTEDMESYFACSEVKPTLYILPNLIYKLDSILTERIVDHIDWDPKVQHLKAAILEDVSNTPILERGLHGAALGQGRAFAIYDLMNRSSAFIDKHIPYWFANVQIDINALKSLQDGNLGKLTLS